MMDYDLTKPPKPTASSSTLLSDHPAGALQVDQTDCPMKRQCEQFEDIQQMISDEEAGVQNVFGNASFPTSSYNVEVTDHPTGENEYCHVEVQKPSGIGSSNGIFNSMNGYDTILDLKSYERASDHAYETCYAYNNHDNFTTIADNLPNLYDYDHGIHKHEKASNEDLSLQPVGGLLGKRRKKEPKTKDCKRCSCKKTRCLKLYCECFSAGEFCDEQCICQGCWNNLDYEDTVFDTRENIQSRDPFAFAPKIQHDDSISSSPHSSTRHKRGCNCKKSKCLKKYCECYQANIACSNTCRCQGCENTLATKEEHVVMKDLVFKQETDESMNFSLNNQLEARALQNRLSIPHNLTYIEPTTQFINYAEAANSWYPTPEFEAPIVTPYEMFTTGSTFHANNQGFNNEMINLDPLDMPSNRVMESLNQFAPVCNQPGNFSPPSFDIPNLQNRVNNTNTEIFSEDNNQIQTARSLHWGDPHIIIYPINHFGENRFLETAGGVCHIADNIMPEVFVQNPTLTDSIKKVSSSTKRVSAPSNESVFSPNFSAPTMDGREYVLQNIPLKPPTPFIDPEDFDDDRDQ